MAHRQSWRAARRALAFVSRLLAYLLTMPQGDSCCEELERRGIDVSSCVVLPRRSTAVCVHLVRPGAERDRAMISWRGCDYDLTAAMVRRAMVDSVRHVHVGSFYLLPELAPSLAGIFSEARARGCTTSLDPQGDPEGQWRRGLGEVLRRDRYLPPQSKRGTARWRPRLQTCH